MESPQRKDSPTKIVRLTMMVIDSKKMGPSEEGPIFSWFRLATEVQFELVRVWTKSQWLDFVLTLVVDPVFD
ncbi:MAG: hypothetical protein RIS82_230 [Actinomycetota bacterium]